ncbi:MULTISPECIES: enoyl-ACP reductase FabI [Streptomyces]|uniref:Enoyl-[acyl-carrier-protein] reductase [NADH] n=1 Tax=Streptomyces thermoviolaceus subsp. thermoviolaceus TaxID=66860 RepID=A0ABX0YYV1_STRTL|nr:MULTISPECIES: enoyl-ACP reductase FabI [Streptomyces]NJP17268.1 enoyl-ACP reductase FabI [Streptomyces thermoviolaceus subsp. thermoviolaceus]RSR98606.1 enoyl-[acyl-carrier-protein] reductase FabI [Streptomyces sp. WAC00469]WTD48595.1 enoyl-ACP reductase FabI [Streptomyces thermoviolaceus]GGV83316.1 enoyl-[acyl-carrier-protein] reductase [NADH] [Streptomyces thermoviolaceus subsp. apingens]GHB10738.1 enoyl-[acyl-carrier-protein] reductase [NADH] [Streptomyces thermoviolaceus subsp. thermovi
MDLTGRRILVFGVLTETSMGYRIAEAATRAGADVILANAPGRPSSIMGRIAGRLPKEPVACLSADITEPGDLAALADGIAGHWEALDGVVHAVAFAPQDALGGNFLNTPFESVATAMNVSAFSLKALTVSVLPLLEKSENRGSVVSLTFDASVAWPAYDWMGPAKAALEATNRYLARYLGPKGIRVNAVDSGPITTMASRSIPGFEELAEEWPLRAPLGWDTSDASPVADAVVFLLSDAARAITGQVLHVDGGVSAVGA